MFFPNMFTTSSFSRRVRLRARIEKQLQGKTTFMSVVIHIMFRNFVMINLLYRWLLISERESSQCCATADSGLVRLGADVYRVRNSLGPTGFSIRQGDWSAPLGGPVRWKCSLSQALTIVRPWGAPQSTQLWKRKSGACNRRGNCSPRSSWLYRLSVSQAWKAKELWELRAS